MYPRSQCTNHMFMYNHWLHRTRDMSLSERFETAIDLRLTSPECTKYYRDVVSDVSVAMLQKHSSRATKKKPRDKETPFLTYTQARARPRGWTRESSGVPGRHGTCLSGMQERSVPLVAWPRSTLAHLNKTGCELERALHAAFRGAYVPGRPDAVSSSPWAADSGSAGCPWQDAAPVTALDTTESPHVSAIFRLTRSRYNPHGAAQRGGHLPRASTRIRISRGAPFSKLPRTLARVTLPRRAVALQDGSTYTTPIHPTSYGRIWTVVAPNSGSRVYRLVTANERGIMLQHYTLTNHEKRSLAKRENATRANLIDRIEHFAFHSDHSTFLAQRERCRYSENREIHTSLVTFLTGGLISTIIWSPVTEFDTLDTRAHAKLAVDRRKNVIDIESGHNETAMLDSDRRETVAYDHVMQVSQYFPRYFLHSVRFSNDRLRYTDNRETPRLIRILLPSISRNVYLKTYVLTFHMYTFFSKV